MVMAQKKALEEAALKMKLEEEAKQRAEKLELQKALAEAKAAEEA